LRNNLFIGSLKNPGTPIPIMKHQELVHLQRTILSTSTYPKIKCCILKNVAKFKSIGTKTVSTFFKVFSFMFLSRKKVIKVWR